MMSPNAPPGRGTIVFAPLAMNQTRFYVGIARELRGHGYDAEFASFHEGSVSWIRDHGFKAYNVYHHIPVLPAGTLADFAAVASGYGITDLHRVISHEKAAYELTDSLALARKLAGYLYAMTSILRETAEHSRGPIRLVHELGGFLSVVAGFYAARALAIDNIFAEPSFFRGRVFLNRNTFSARRVEPGAAGMVTTEVKKYLRDTIDARRIVVPKKDEAHYRGAVTKVANLHNARRLVQKSFEKHVQGRREEFSHIGSHVRRHLRMVRNAQTLRSWYRDVPEGQRFVYYPLHVPADVALTIRAPEYLDQYALIEYVARNVPASHMVAIKEHPALVGAVSPVRIRELLQLRDNVVLLPAGYNNHDVMRRADAVITVNSKSGAEALMLGRPVLALGDSFYRDCGLVAKAESLADVPAVLHGLLNGGVRQTTAVERFFQAVWEASAPGEIFDDSEQNCAAFASSLHNFFSAVAPVEPAIVAV